MLLADCITDTTVSGYRVCLGYNRGEKREERKKIMTKEPYEKQNRDRDELAISSVHLLCEYGSIPVAGKPLQDSIACPYNIAPTPCR